MNRSFEVVIMGLSLDLLSNKTDLLCNIAKHINVSFESWHVAFTTIIRGKNKSKNGDILLVRFISPEFKMNWLKAKKLKGDVEWSDILQGQPDSLIYINQRQTAAERSVLLEARTVIKSLNYHSCWLSEGTVIYKKTADGRTFKYSSELKKSLNMDTTPTITVVETTTQIHTATATATDSCVVQSGENFWHISPGNNSINSKTNQNIITRNDTNSNLHFSASPVSVSSLSTLSVALVNAQSLSSHIDEFRDRFSIANEKSYHIIAVTESWLKNHMLDSVVFLDGYFLLRNDRNYLVGNRISRGGGVCV